VRRVAEGEVLIEAGFDLERDADVQELLGRFNISAHDVPVVICRGTTVLRNPTNQQMRPADKPAPVRGSRIILDSLRGFRGKNSPGARTPRRRNSGRKS
jgi:hypothetical protein